jgi:hypothetical protein
MTFQSDSIAFRDLDVSDLSPSMTLSYTVWKDTSEDEAEILFTGSIPYIFTLRTASYYAPMWVQFYELWMLACRPLLTLGSMVSIYKYIYVRG